MKHDNITIAKCIALEVLATTEQKPTKLTGIFNGIYEDLKSQSPEEKEKQYDEIIKNL